MNLDFKYPEKLFPVTQSNKRNIVLYGGRGGAKSWFIAAFLIQKAIGEKDKLILCTREIQNTIKDSVYSILKNMIEMFQIENRFIITNTEIKSDTGSKFIFKGLRHNIMEIKSTEGVDYCWIEEAQSVSQESIDILWPTIRKPGSQFFISFNPDQDSDPIYQRFVTKTRDDSLVIKINYTDNMFCPQILLSEAEWDKENDYEKYLHVWEGNCKTISDSCIFRNKFKIINFETPDNVDFFLGADWGFSNDPSCLVRNFIKDDCLYIDYEAGGVGIEFEELLQLWDSVPGSRQYKIVADNSRPDTISYMNRNGFVVRPSRKGKNSIEDGIEFMRSFKYIYIHERCKNTAYEFKSYSYKKDRLTGEILPIIIDKDNHYIDAIRYSLEDARRGKTITYSPEKKKLHELFKK